MNNYTFNYKAVFSAICRTCLRIKKNMKPLNSSGVADMWIYCAFLEVSDGDGFPSSICIQCFSQVKRSFSFKQLCEKSDSTLKKYSHLGYLPSEVTLQPGISKLDGDPLLHVNEKHQADSLSVQTVAVMQEEFEIFTVSHSDNDNRLGLNKSLQLKFDADCNVIEDASSVLQIKNGRNNYISESHQLDSEKSNVELIVEEANLNFSSERIVKVKKKQVPSVTKPKEDLGESKYFCEPCSIGFESSEDLSIHMCTHKNGKTIQCNVCEKTFEKLKTLKRHVKIHMSAKKHKCNLCPKQFTEAGSLKKHLNRHAGVKGTTYSCSVCKKVYTDANYLKIHLRKHTGEKPFQCQICSKTFSDPRLLASHTKTHNQERIHHCNVCTRSFTHASTLNSHSRIHTGEKPYKCAYCQKSFIQSSNLSLHVRTHTGDKPYVCSVCNKGFGSSSNLAYHARIHTGEKHFLCFTCGKSFARSEDVRIHMRTHTGEKPFQCSFCPKRFTTSSHKKDHMHTHGTQSSYVCSVCGICSPSRSKYRIHMKTHSQPKEEAIDVTSPKN